MPVFHDANFDFGEVRKTFDVLKMAQFHIECCNRDTSSWCMDAMYCENSDDDFKQCLAHRGDPKTWRDNRNAYALPGVMNFVRKLPMFQEVGCEKVVAGVIKYKIKHTHT